MFTSKEISMKKRKLTMPWNYFKPKSPDVRNSHLNNNRPRAQTFNEEGVSTVKPETTTPYQHFRNAIFVRKNDEDDLLQQQPYRTFRILLLGIQRVGKTSILERFLRDRFSEKYVKTVAEHHESQIFVELDNKLKRFDLTFHDFQGNLKTQQTHRYREEIENSDGFVLVHTKNELESFPTILEFVADIKKIKKQDHCILVVENKCDDLCYFGELRVTRRSFDLDGCINAAVSAKTNKNISTAIAKLVEEMERSRIDKDDLWC